MNNSSSTFTTSWSRLTWVLTVFAMFLVVLSSILVLCFLVYPDNSIGFRAATILLVMSVPILMLGYVIRRSPRGYIVGFDSVPVSRRCGNAIIPLRKIVSIDIMDGSYIFGHSVRLYASGGWFGFWGTFSSPGVGRDFVAYTTRINGPLVMIHLTDGDPVVLSPDNPDEFVSSVRNTIASANK